MSEETRPTGNGYGIKVAERAGGDGLTMDEFFDRRFNGMGNGWRSFLLLPRYTDFERKEISLCTTLGGMPLEYPFITSPMDTVTDARIARLAARHGGFGCIHVNLSRSQQAHEISKVKLGCFISDPVVLPPTAPMTQVEALQKQYSNIPVTVNGHTNRAILGMITKDLRATAYQDTAEDCMTPAVTVFKDEILDSNGTVLMDVAIATLDAAVCDVLAVIMHDGSLYGIIVRSDLIGIRDGSRIATRDPEGKLRVGAAVSTIPLDYQTRVPVLVDNGVDMICVDTAHGDSVFVVRAVNWIKNRYPSLVVMAGNISTGGAAVRLIDAGANILRVGNGPGAACTTQDETGTGSSPAAALYRVARVAFRHDVDVVADGGIETPGDIVHALALGASAFMGGSFFARLPESPAPRHTDGQGRVYKVYRGMASEEAYRERVAVRYDDDGTLAYNPEGIKVFLPLSPKPFAEYIHTKMNGVRSAFNYLGVRSIQELQEEMREGRILMEYRQTAVR